MSVGGGRNRAVTTDWRWQEIWQNTRHSSEGAAYLSPARQCWVSDQLRPSPIGTAPNKLEKRHVRRIISTHASHHHLRHRIIDLWPEEIARAGQRRRRRHPRFQARPRRRRQERRVAPPAMWQRAPSPVESSEARQYPYAACATPTGCPQSAHRRASIGISLRHSGHFLVVGSAGAGALRIRATSMFTGVTTKK